MDSQRTLPFSGLVRLSDTESDQPEQLHVIAPARAIIGGNVFYGSQAQIVLLVEAGVFWVIAVGMMTGRRWALLLSLFYMAETVVSYLVFIVAYMDARPEWNHVRMAAQLGPSPVLITLYLWRSRDLIFDPARRWQSAPVRSAPENVEGNAQSR